jgi:hypothetical protein
MVVACPLTAATLRLQPPSPTEVRLTAVGYNGWFTQACNRRSARRLDLQPLWATVAAVRRLVARFAKF